MAINYCSEQEKLNIMGLFASAPRDVDIKPLYTYLCPVIIFVCFFSVIFNAILMGISRQSKVVNKSPILLLSLNLAVTDLIASLMNGLGILFNSYLPEVHDIKTGECWMLIFEVIRCAALVASALHLLALAFVHYRGIVNPLHYRSSIFFSQHLSRSINLISIGCWIFPLTILLVEFTATPCQGFQTANCEYFFLMGFTFRYILLASFALPLVAMVVIYMRIFIIISRHQKGRRQNHQIEQSTTAAAAATGSMLSRRALSASGPVGSVAAVALNLPKTNVAVDYMETVSANEQLSQKAEEDKKMKKRKEEKVQEDARLCSVCAASKVAVSIEKSEVQLTTNVSGQKPDNRSLAYFQVTNQATEEAANAASVAEKQKGKEKEKVEEQLRTSSSSSSSSSSSNSHSSSTTDSPVELDTSRNIGVGTNIKFSLAQHKHGQGPAVTTTTTTTTATSDDDDDDDDDDDGESPISNVSFLVGATDSTSYREQRKGRNIHHSKPTLKKDNNNNNSSSCKHSVQLISSVNDKRGKNQLLIDVDDSSSNSRNGVGVGPTLVVAKLVVTKSNNEEEQILCDQNYNNNNNSNNNELNDEDGGPSLFEDNIPVMNKVALNKDDKTEQKQQPTATAAISSSSSSVSPNETELRLLNCDEGNAVKGRGGVPIGSGSVGTDYCPLSNSSVHREQQQQHRINATTATSSKATTTTAAAFDGDGGPSGDGDFSSTRNPVRSGTTKAVVTIASGVTSRRSDSCKSRHQRNASKLKAQFSLGTQLLEAGPPILSVDSSSSSGGARPGQQLRLPSKSSLKKQHSSKQQHLTFDKMNRLNNMTKGSSSRSSSSSSRSGSNSNLEKSSWECTECDNKLGQSGVRLASGSTHAGENGGGLTCGDLSPSAATATATATATALDMREREVSIEGTLVTMSLATTTSTTTTTATSTSTTCQQGCQGRSSTITSSSTIHMNPVNSLSLKGRKRPKLCRSMTSASSGGSPHQQHQHQQHKQRLFTGSIKSNRMILETNQSNNSLLSRQQSSQTHTSALTRTLTNTCSITAGGGGGGGGGSGRYYEPQRRHIHASAVPQTNTKALVTTLLILGTYFISYVPAILFQVLTCIDKCPYPLYVIPFSRRVLLGSITTILVIAKSIIDPLIYSYRMSEVKMAINHYLTKRRSKSSLATSMLQTSQRFGGGGGGGVGNHAAAGGGGGTSIYQNNTINHHTNDIDKNCTFNEDGDAIDRKSSKMNRNNVGSLKILKQQQGLAGDRNNNRTGSNCTTTDEMTPNRKKLQAKRFQSFDRYDFYNCPTTVIDTDATVHQEEKVPLNTDAVDCDEQRPTPAENFSIGGRTKETNNEDGATILNHQSSGHHEEDNNGEKISLMANNNEQRQQQQSSFITSQKDGNIMRCNGTQSTTTTKH